VSSPEGSLRCAAIVACAGSAVRMGAGTDKLLLTLRDREVVAWTVQALDASSLLERLVVVASESNLERIAAILDGLPTRLPLELVVGGARRQDSVRIAMQHLAATDPPDLVLIHDGARPLVSEDLIRRSIEAATVYGAATCALPLRNACKETDGKGFVRRSIERAPLVSVQTPQAFRFDFLARAHQAGVEQGAVVDDDAELIERLGLPVRVVEGEYRNVKITTPDDLPVIEAHLASTR
jgi:2-C-methyl-D-erythritol 4-phosphate cytidylyltransferase